MKFLTMIVLVMFGTSAFAGFQGYQGTTNLGLAQAVKCSTGLTCSKVGEKLVMVASNMPGIISQSTAVTLTSSDCGKTVSNPAAVSVNFPAGSTSLIGCKFTAVVGSGGLYLNMGASDKIVGLTSVNGNYILNSSVSNNITLEYLSSGLWFPRDISGTWTQGN